MIGKTIADLAPGDHQIRDPSSIQTATPSRSTGASIIATS